MAKVVFRPSGKTIECEIGDNLLEVARRADVYIEAPCNGSKSCGKCKVKLLTGEVNQEVSSHLSDEDRENGFILACCTTIISDIEVLTNSSLDMAMRGMTFEEVMKATGLDERQLAGAIGWLAREDKIIFNAPHDGKQC